MNQQTMEEFKTEYDKALFKMHSASGRKEAVYWCHRASELKQVMESKSLYQAGYSGIC